MPGFFVAVVAGFSLTTWGMDHASPVRRARPTEPVSRGPNVTPSEVKAVVRIRAGSKGCSATLMGPKPDAPSPRSLVVLTASHCLNGARDNIQLTILGGKSHSASCTGNPAYYGGGGAKNDFAACAIPASETGSILQEMGGAPLACLPKAPLKTGDKMDVIGFGGHPTIRGQNRGLNKVKELTSQGVYELFDGANGYTPGDSGGFNGTVGPGGQLTLHAVTSSGRGSGTREIFMSPYVLSSSSQKILGEFLQKNTGSSVCVHDEAAPDPGGKTPTPAPSSTATPPPAPAPEAPVPTPNPPLPPPKPDREADRDQPLVVDKIASDVPELKVGDTIASVNGRRVRSLAGLRAEIAALLQDTRAEDVLLTVTRNGKRERIAVPITEALRRKRTLGIYIRRAPHEEGPDEGAW